MPSEGRLTVHFHSATYQLTLSASPLSARSAVSSGSSTLWWFTLLSNIERHHRLPLNRAITTKVIYRLGELSQIIVQIHCNYLNISETWPPLEGRSLSFGCSPTRQVTTKQQVQLDKMRIIQQTDLSWPVVDSVSSASGCVHFYFSKPHDRCGGVFKKFWDFFFSF